MLPLLLDHSDVKRNELCGPCPNALGADHQFERSLKTCTSGPELLQVALSSKILSSELDNRLGCKFVYGGDGYLVAKLAKCSRQHLSAFLLFSGRDFGALLDEAHAFIPDLQTRRQSR